MKKKSIWKWILLGVLALALLIVFLVVEIQDRQLKRQREELLSRAEPLEMQVNQLIGQRDALYRQMKEDSYIPATEQLLFLELDPLLFEEAYPLMMERGIVGVLGLEEGNLPGDPGRLTRRQFDRLLADGWETCLICRDPSGFEEWDREMSLMLKNAEIEKPRAVYFAENTFRSDLSETVLACGYTVAIHHGEGGLSLISGDADESLWLSGASRWNNYTVKERIQELIRLSGQHCFTLRFPGGAELADEPDTEIYYTEKFIRMLDYVQPYLEEGSLRITGLTQAREQHDPEKNGVNEAIRQYELSCAELDEQTRLLRAQIRSIYMEWGEDGNG